MENIPSPGEQDLHTRRPLGLRWFLWREPRIVDYIAIAVIAPLLVAGVLWVVSVAVRRGGESHGYSSSTRQLSSRGGTHVKGKGATGLAEPMYLDDLPKENGSQFELGPVSIGGRTYNHGIQFEVNWIGTEWEVNYAIPHGAHTFSAIIGNDDHQTTDLWMYMSLLYEVLADGRLVGSGHVKGYSQDGPIHADVAGKARLTLKVTVVSGSDSTTADWAEPVFH
jgi:hypothetical protein